MAVHNGERYLKEQLRSILTQTCSVDEVVVVDDASTDTSVGIVDGLGERRIVLVRQQRNAGVARTFERALETATGSVVFLSDQDDVWADRKVERMMDAFTSRQAAAVVCDAAVVDSSGRTVAKSFFEWRNSGPGLVKNYWKNTFLGCCMAVTSQVRDLSLPFPRAIRRMPHHHDQWLGMMAELVGPVTFVPEPLTFYRRHDENVSGMKRYAWPKAIGLRVKMAAALLERAPRMMAFKARRHAG